MIYEEFQTFDNLFINLNKNLLYTPDKYIKEQKGDNFYLNLSIFHVKEPVCTLDFSALGYQKGKFYKLLNNYVDLDYWEEFKLKIRDSRSLSLTFYFNKTKKIKGNNKDASPCILNLVFGRSDRNNKFNELNIFYRTTEINRAFYIDLLLFSKMIEDLGDLIDINSINIIIPYGFLKGARAFWLLNYLNFDLNQNNYLTDYLIKQKDKYENKNLSKFRMIKRIQLYLKNQKTYKPINVKELNITEGRK